ncbi:MAG: dihydrodipicolinate reductase, partial [Tepidisphaeraceae bacterium]
VVGGIDIDPGKIGKSLGDVTGLARLAGAKVYRTFQELAEKNKPDVILHTAGSKADVAIGQIMPMAEQGVSVVSSCEELLVPKFRAPKLAEELDAICKKNNARVLGTGVNPGFVMDLLPVCMTGVSRTVEHVYCERVVNATTRRQPLQKKIGSGMDPDEMRRLFKEGKAGHAGFLESLALIGHAMGWAFTETYELFEPVIAPYDITTKFFEVNKGQCCGIHQQVVGKVGDGPGGERVHMDLKMYLDARDPHDAIKITGDPPLDVRINGGVAGDHATVASLVNAVPRILKAPAGVLLMTDVATPAWR